ncbi:MAG: hypothetical protein J6C82_00995 [Clostridia bacterium]|nr:hypothetical protein [Clostridia bacterium]
MKKIISHLLAAAMLAAWMPAMAEGETVTVEARSGKTPAYGETLTAVFSGEGDDITVTWQRVDGSNSEDIKTGDEYIVTEADMGYKIRASVSDGTNTYTSEEYSIASYVESHSRNEDAIVNAASDEDALFKLKGSDREFVLAETFNNSESKYFVVANELYGKKAISTENGYQKFNSEEEGSFQAWINSDFAGSGIDGVKLPEKLLSYINYSHIWRTEGTTAWTSNNIDSYTFKAGITIPSVSELVYYDRVGYDVKSTEGESADKIMTRTPVNHSAALAPNWIMLLNMQYSQNSSTQVRLVHGASPEEWVRPQFYLKDGFFANVAVDLSSAGEDIINLIKQEDADSLYELYSAYEAVNILGLEPPEGYLILSDICMETKSGETPAYGETVIPKFKYDSSNVNPFEKCEYEWVSGGETVSNAEEYIITEADAGRKLKFFVTVWDTEGNETMHESEEIEIPAISISPVAPNSSTGNIANADAANVFDIGGQKFTLVDSFNNSKSTFYVIANAVYGNKSFSSPIMNTNDTTSLSYWLNNTFLTEGNGTAGTLPASVKSYIDFEHMWLTEGAPDSASGHSAYSFAAGVTIPSVSELIRYKDVIGVSDTGARYWLRTNINYANTKHFMGTIAGTGTSSAINHWDIPNGSTGIRPQFYLGEDFFKNIAIDLTLAGSNVIAAMAQRYTIEELEHLYDAAVLEELGFGYEFEFDASFTSGGVKAETLAGITELTAEVTLTSNTDKGLSGLVIYALYDEKGATQAIRFARIETEAQTSADISMTLTGLSGITADYNAKVMLWDNSYSMNVLNNFVSFK